MRQMRIQFIVLTLILVFSANAKSVHPRVVELEDKYKHQAMEYLKTRFPHFPFSVVISIDPLRRVGGDSYQNKQESLPYFTLEEEEIKDEWDDPNASLYVLSRRIKSVEVIVSVPSKVADEEIAEIRDTLISTLRLIPARDNIIVQKREWTGIPNFTLYAGIAVGILFLCLLVAFGFLRFALKRLGKHFSDIQSTLGGRNNAPIVSSPTSAMPNNPAENTSLGHGSGQYGYADPIKVREVIGTKIHELIYSDEFPRLEDMIHLDQEARINPRLVGALLVEFPLDVQRKLFSLSSGEHWMEAISSPGELNVDALEMIESLTRVQRAKKGKQWENLLIQIWRMQESCVEFLRALPQEEALAILHPMPKFFSVPMAREAFPGSWAVMLDPNYRPLKITNERLEHIYEVALEELPTNDFDLLEKYKQEKDLIQYLNISDVGAEKDIYQASPKDAMIHKIRPPFYRLLQEEGSVLEGFVDHISIDEWAISLFNVARDERKRIEQYFTDKQKYIYLEKLKMMDTDRLDSKRIGQIREKIARSFIEHMRELERQNMYDNEELQEEADAAVENSDNRDVA